MKQAIFAAAILSTATIGLFAIDPKPASALVIKGAVHSIQNPFSFVPPANRADTIGWAFRVDQQITINALGVYDFGADGLSNEYEVAIYSTTTEALVSPVATVPAGTAAALVDSFRWVTVNPFTLVAGTYAVGAYGTYGSNGGDAFVSFQNNSVPNYQVRNGIQFIESREKVGIIGSPAGISYPSETECSQLPTGFCNGIWGGNFSIAHVPAPMPFMGAAAAFAYSRTLRDRIRRSARPSFSPGD